jgi:hypothetical protein
MTLALTLKELRESAAIAFLGFLALLAIVAGNMGLGPLPGIFGRPGMGQIPFVSDSFLYQFTFASGALAIAVGLKQSLSDFIGEAHRFLLHRPVSRQRIYGTKLIVGLGICVLLNGAAVIAYAIWAALPETHASPFDWQMTAVTWRIWFAMTAIYLGAFLSGIRPAAWLGTRLAPLAASAGIILLSFLLPSWWAWSALFFLDGVLVMIISDVVTTRDFA